MTVSHWPQCADVSTSAARSDKGDGATSALERSGTRVRRANAGLMLEYENYCIVHWWPDKFLVLFL